MVTNGILLTEKTSKCLIEAGLNRIHISIEALSDVGYEEVTGIRIDFDELVHNIDILARLRNKANSGLVIYVKIADIACNSEAEEDMFYRTFGNICDEMFVEIVQPIWSNSDSKEIVVEKGIGSYGQKLTTKMVCPFLFTRLMVTADGMVPACCLDWQKRILLGDANHQSLKDIWNGSVLRNMQMVHLSKKRDQIPLCNGCNLPSSSTTDDIDKFADELLKRYA
jgi:MoaA/NifB/PqqE/SkfB family radical SAM enzyme